MGLRAGFIVVRRSIRHVPRRRDPSLGGAYRVVSFVLTEEFTKHWWREGQNCGA
jgi:hypothetical protein